MRPEVATSSSVLRDMVFPRSFVTVFRPQSKLAVNESSVYDGMYLLIRLTNRCRQERVILRRSLLSEGGYLLPNEA